MGITSRRIGSFVRFGLLALGMIGAGSAVWGALLYVNLRTTPLVPWALPALLAVLWAAWRYLGGRWWPARTSAARKRLLRANPVAPDAFIWSIVAGLLAIVALAGFWIVMFRLVPMPPNPVLPGRFASSPIMVAAIIVGASLLAPIIEESAVRGYLQSALERSVSPIGAVLLSSFVFAMAHVTQGVIWPKLLFYYLVGVAFGSLACLVNSILPVIPLHAVGDLVFFVLIWPHDGARTPLARGGADGWFWLHVAQTVVFGGLSVLAFLKLRALQNGAATAKVEGSSAEMRKGN